MNKKKHIHQWISGGVDSNQLLWDEMAALFDWVHAPFQTSDGDGGFYEDTALTTLVSHGSEVQASKGFGLNVPSVPNLLLDSSDDATTMELWYKGEGSYPQYIVRDGFDKYVRVWNGASWRIMTNPGGISPVVGAP